MYEIWKPHIRENTLYIHTCEYRKNQIAYTPFVHNIIHIHHSASRYEIIITQMYERDEKIHLFPSLNCILYFFDVVNLPPISLNDCNLNHPACDCIYRVLYHVFISWCIFLFLGLHPIQFVITSTYIIISIFHILSYLV